MTEEQHAIARIHEAIQVAREDNPIELGDYALAKAAWNEMKAIAQEGKTPTIVQLLLSPTVYPQYDPSHDNYIHRNGKRSYDKAGKHPV